LTDFDTDDDYAPQLVYTPYGLHNMQRQISTTAPKNLISQSINHLLAIIT